MRAAFREAARLRAPLAAVLAAAALPVGCAAAATPREPQQHVPVLSGVVSSGGATQPHQRSPAELAHLHPALTLLDTRAVRCLLTVLRDERTIHLDFAAAADRLMRILAEEGLAALPTVRPKTVRTPCGTYDGLELPPQHTVAVVSIVRAGDTLLEAVRRAVPGVAVGKILIQRDEASPTKDPRLIFTKLPADLSQRVVLLVDPMLATGQSAAVAIEQLLAVGVPQQNIVFLNVVACPEGLALLRQRFPGVAVVTAAVDDGLNAHKYIVPGLGDYGDRYFGTESVPSR